MNPPFLNLIVQHGVPKILKAIEAVVVMPERLKNQWANYSGNQLKGLESNTQSISSPMMPDSMQPLYVSFLTTGIRSTTI